MMKKLQLLLIISVMSQAWLAAQDTIPDLIISEQRMDWGNEAYIELTNMEDTAIDLSQFMFASPWSPPNNKFYFAPNTMLAPGESYVLCNKWEKPEQDWLELQEIADQFVFPEEANYFDVNPGHDSISVGEYVLQTWVGKYASILYYLRSDVDSMVIDCFNWNRGEDGTDNIKMDQSIAGVDLPVSRHTLIRKSSVTEGNLGDWEISRGVDATDSEWLLAEFPTYDQVIPFYTVGNHGENYPIVASSANDDVVLDMDNGTLTVPWGIYRGDSIIRELNLGDGMAWTLYEKAVFEDSVHNVLQTGDTLQLKSFGTTMQTKDLSIIVSPPASNMNLAFPVRSVGPLDADDPTSIQVIKGTRYYVTDGIPTIDTIGDVPFATRADTMFAYIEWASNASAEIVWKDESERVDLLNGDILEVTAEDGSKKQYYIDVLEYNMNDNVNVSAITWPDITMQHMLFDLNWITDTIPGFEPNRANYEVLLKFGTRNVPVFKAYSEDLNAKISYSPAISLSGGVNERTTVITVTSESDTLTKDYFITFNIEERAEDKQEFHADPFFAEFHQRSYVQLEALEICNPGNMDLDLSNYLISRTNSADAITSVTQTLEYLKRYQLYVPGYRFTDDTTAYENEDYKRLVKFDGDVDPIVEPGGVFTIAVGQSTRWVEKGQPSPDWNITFDIEIPNAWGLMFEKGSAILERNTSTVMYLWRIDNDSIQQGLKPIGDLNDLTLIDVLGHNDGTNLFYVAGYDGGNTGGGVSIIRKPSIWKGNDSYLLSGGTTAEESEWIVRPPADKTTALLTMGSQPLDPVTQYMSTVSSLVYIVDKGYQGDLGITGIGNGETVQQFFDNLIQPDTAQDLSVKTSTDGAILELTAPVSQGDTLVVVSADGNNITKYVLDVTPLD
ncbi:MAG: hypothetical protein KAS71_15185, partial [Bacteroidales bacterium]|nr:hypothetical protein [Bacteroidales bacterium]